MTIAASTIDLIVISGQANLVTAPNDDHGLNSNAVLNGELSIGITANRADKTWKSPPASPPIAGGVGMELEIKRTHEIVFIEDNVEDYGLIISAIGADKEIHILDSSQNGLDQIVALLRGRSNIDALHIIGHGTRGALNLGSFTLNEATLAANAAQVQAIGQSLRPDADILLYGCNVAAGAAGREFVKDLAAVSGADIAASTNLTGAAEQGGDWQLELSQGDIEAQAAVDPELAKSYSQVLGISAATVNFDTLANFTSYGGSQPSNDVIYKVSNNTSYRLIVDGNMGGIFAYQASPGYLYGARGNEDKVTFRFDGGKTFSPQSILLTNGSNLSQTFQFKGYNSNGAQVNNTISSSLNNGNFATISFNGWTTSITKLVMAATSNSGLIKDFFLDDFVLLNIQSAVVSPTVSSITRINSNNTNASSVGYTVVFSQSVSNVDVSDFSLTATGTASGTIASVSGSGTTYTISVSSISGDGTLRLDLKSSGTGIVNGSSTAIAGGYTSGETYTFDHTAPAVSTPDLRFSSDSGYSNIDNKTKITTPLFIGTADAASLVTLYDSDGTTVLGSATASGSGNWTITSSVLTEGVHLVSAKASDAVGNVSAASSSLSLTIDLTAPVGKPGTPVLSAGDDTGSSNSDGITTNDSPQISGSGVEAGGYVEVYDSGTLSFTTPVDGSGNWNNAFSGLSEGSHSITVKQYDAAGNVDNTASDSMTIVVDNTAPVASIAVADNNLTAGETATVSITFNEAIAGFTNSDLNISNGTLSAVSSTDNGITWTATLTPTNNINVASNVVTLNNNGVFDLAGNTSSGTTNSNNY